jgi:hypothetical protein
MNESVQPNLPVSEYGFFGDCVGANLEGVGALGDESRLSLPGKGDPRLDAVTACASPSRTGRVPVCT